jgi:hypothetical protein
MFIIYKGLLGGHTLGAGQDIETENQGAYHPTRRCQIVCWFLYNGLYHDFRKTVSLAPNSSG